MNAAEFMARAAGILACRHDFARGYRYDNIGRRITGCEECNGCDSGAKVEQIGLTGSMEIINDGGQMRLRWPCPGCGFPVNEDTSALSAIEDAREIEKDPLCVACRNRHVA